MKIKMVAARKNAGFTQAEMAKLLNKCDKTIIDWEKGRKKPRVDEFEAYCRVCGMKPEQVQW